MFTIRKTFKVEYAHQLDKAFTSCCHETIHGHSGIVEVFISSPQLDSNNMVLDFGEISSQFKQHIIDTYDHALFIPETFSKTYITALKKFNKKLRITCENPTAEYFALSLYQSLNQILDKYLHPKYVAQELLHSISVQKVRFHETDTGYAEYQG